MEAASFVVTHPWRLPSAISLSCGHIFCWTCIQVTKMTMVSSRIKVDSILGTKWVFRQTLSKWGFRQTLSYATTPTSPAHPAPRRSQRRTLVTILNVSFSFTYAWFSLVMEDILRVRRRSRSRSRSPLLSPRYLTLSQTRSPPSPNSRGEEGGREEEILPTQNVMVNFEDDNDTLEEWWRYWLDWRRYN